MKYGFIKVASAVPSVKVADCVQNTKEMEVIIAQAEGRGVEIIVFPELSVTGYTCQDLFREQLLLDAAENSVMALLDFTRQLDIICIVGAPRRGGRPVAQLWYCASERQDLGHCSQDLSPQLQ